MRRDISFIVIFLIYGFAFSVGVVVFLGLTIESMILRVIIADIVATLVVFLFSTRFKNSSIYDPYWSVAPLVIVPFFVETWSLASILLVGVIAFWAIRLTFNWAMTFKGLDHEDWRYQYFKERFPRLWPLVNLLGIHLMPTAIVIMVMIPALLYLLNNPTINPVVFLGAFLSTLATLIQWHSDKTIHQFKRTNPKQICNQGLWQYSRHPNYFGEILMWFGVFVMLMGVAPSYYYSGIGPIINLLLFLSVSIPLMEQRQLKRKEGYNQYIEQTNMLIPLPILKTRREQVLNAKKR